MCNRYGLKTPISRIVTELARWELPIVKPSPHELPNLPEREHIRPTDTAPILRPIDGGLELAELRWGLIPWFCKGAIRDFKGLNTNTRAERPRRFAASRGLRWW